MTRWNHQIVSNDDTLVFDTNTSWIEVIKLMDQPINVLCRSNNITNQMPYKIRALISSARATRGPKETSSITLEHGRAQPWSQVIDLVCLNASDGHKDFSITINSVWTPAGLQPPEPELAAKPEASSTSRTGRRTKRSLLSTSKY